MSEAAGPECPVMTAWTDLPDVVSRAGKGRIAAVSSRKLTRQTCVDNAELLIPLILEVGTFAQLLVHLHVFMLHILAAHDMNSEVCGPAFMSSMTLWGASCTFAGPEASLWSPATSLTKHEKKASMKELYRELNLLEQSYSSREI